MFRNYWTKLQIYNAYAFQQMQRDNGTKSGKDAGYTTLFRGYDTEGGRWNMIDPKWRELPSKSPYCGMGNNPVNMVDPWGDEGIVVSGGEYNDSYHPRYKYNFIEPSITRLKQLKSSLPKYEPITWLVINAGYSEVDLKYFKYIAKELGVGFQSIGSADEFSNYLNSKNVYDGMLSNSRKEDKITSMSIFGHGTAGVASFAYRQKEEDLFEWDIDNVKQLDRNAFSKNGVIDFYTCNAATIPSPDLMLGDHSLAYVTAQVTGTTVTGYVGQTTYKYINKGLPTLEGIIYKSTWGFHKEGSKYLPEAGDNAFKRKYVQP